MQYELTTQLSGRLKFVSRSVCTKACVYCIMDKGGGGREEGESKRESRSERGSRQQGSLPQQALLMHQGQLQNQLSPCGFPVHYSLASASSHLWEENNDFKRLIKIPGPQQRLPQTSFHSIRRKVNLLSLETALASRHINLQMNRRQPSCAWLNSRY